jgi:hypothetical protein
MQGNREFMFIFSQKEKYVYSRYNSSILLQAEAIRLFGREISIVFSANFVNILIEIRFYLIKVGSIECEGTADSGIHPQHTSSGNRDRPSSKSRALRNVSTGQ